MKTLRFSLILFWLVTLPVAHAQKQRVAEGRLINRTNASIIASSADLEVLELGSGMSIIKTATTDAAGKFRIEGLPESQRMLIRASYKGVHYHGTLNFNAEGKAHLELEVYEPTSSMKDIRVESVQMAFQVAEDRLRSVETMILGNRTKPPMVYVNPEGNFRISKASGILEPPKLRVTAPGAEMPLVQSALESADGQSYYSLYPLRPGVTTFEIQQALPYADRKYIFSKKFYQDCGPITIGVIPQDLALSGDGLTKKSVNSDQNFAVYQSTPAKAGAEFVWTFSGGTPAAEAASAEESTNATVMALPGIIGRNVLIIGPLLLMGFILVLWYAFNRPQDGLQKGPDLHIRKLRERREQLLTSLAEVDHQNETNAIDRKAYLKQREEGKRELQRIALFFKKM